MLMLWCWCSRRRSARLILWWINWWFCFVPKTRNCDWNLKPGCHDHAIVQVITVDVPAIKCTDCIAITDTSRRLRLATCDLRLSLHISHTWFYDFTVVTDKFLMDGGAQRAQLPVRGRTVPVFGTLEVPGTLSSYKLCIQAHVSDTRYHSAQHRSPYACDDIDDVAQSSHQEVSFFGSRWLWDEIMIILTVNKKTTARPPTHSRYKREV